MSTQTPTLAPTSNTDILAAVQSTGLNSLLLVEYGSRAHGTAAESSDRDLLGVYVERDAQLYGLETAETQNYRLHPDNQLERMGVSANESRSANDDVEMHVHPLRKYVSLAAAGNPTVLSTLWSPMSLEVIGSAAGDLLLTHRDAFLSKHAGFRHAGYARAQRDGMLGITNKRTNRHELVALHSYDTKYAAHMIRVLMAGLDLVRERTVHLPMKSEQIELLQEIRRGEVAKEDLMSMFEKLEHELTTETEESSLPDSVDYAFMNDLLRRVRNEHLGRDL
jgi:predicted nucleotidyltransferase